MPEPDEHAALVDKLAAVARRIDQSYSGVERLRRLSGGAMQETWAFDAIGERSRTPLILRRGFKTLRRDRPHGLSLADEARTIALVGKAGLPVPRVLHVLQECDQLGDGFISEFIEGETLPRRILRDEMFASARKHLAEDCGAILARLHALPIDRFNFLETRPPAVIIARLEEQYRALQAPTSVAELAMRWLRDNTPPEPAMTVVHADFRNGNLMIGPDGVRAVLDWEIAHIGDPAQDLAYIAMRSWRFGNLDKPVGGFGSRDELLRGYRAAGGAVVDPQRLRFWEIAFTFWWGLFCGDCARQFSDRTDFSIERGAIGRRRSESEIDVLDLLTAGL